MGKFSTEGKMEKSNEKFEVCIASYSDSLIQQGKGKGYIECYISSIRQFVGFLKQEHVYYPHQLSSELIRSFQLALYKERDFEFHTVRCYSYRIKDFLKYLNDKGVDIVTDFEVMPKPQLNNGKLKRYYTFDDLLKRYIATQRKWLSYGYSNCIQKHLRMFFKYLRTVDIKNVYSVTEGVILKHRDFLWEEFRSGKDQAIVVKSQIERLRTINNFFKYLYTERIIQEIPSFDLNWKTYFKKIRAEAKKLPKPVKYSDWVPKPLKTLMQKFINYEKVKGKSESTISQYYKDLKIFFDFLDNKGISGIAHVTKRVILDYYTFLLTYKGIRGKGVTSSTRAHLLLSLKIFFKFLARFDYIPNDPAQDVESIREDRHLPKDFMYEKEMERVLEKPNTKEPLGLRDKALLEVLYSTGIRKNELCQLNLSDIDYHEGMLRVNHPKGGTSYQRVIPIGEIALGYIKLYLNKARPSLENGHATQALFLSYKGSRLGKDAPLAIVKKYSFQAGIRKNITAHSFRISCATLMLRNNAGLRHVQEQLGHRRITSTQVYTRLCPLDLKTVHKKCHPRENSH